MKKSTKFSALVLTLSLLFLILFTSCLDVEEEPTPPTIVNVEENLNRLSSNIVQWRSLDFTRFQLIWMQQLGGVRSVPGEVDKYILLPSHLDQSWSVFYAFILTPLVENSGIAMQLGARKHAGVLNGYSGDTDPPFRSY